MARWSGPSSAERPAPPLLIHIHAAVFTLWLFVQTAQIVVALRGNIGLHRRLGAYALGLAAVMVPLGLAAALTSKVIHLDMPGTEPQFLAEIFKPLVRLHNSSEYPGSGLGLAIVYQIVQAHEGKVWARSQVGKGTSFVLRLRRLEDAREQGAAGRTSSVSESASAALAGAGAGGGARG